MPLQPAAVTLGSAFVLAAAGCAAGHRAEPAAFTLEEATVDDLQAALRNGRVDAERLVRLYQARNAAYDAAGPTLRSVLKLDPKAVVDARRLDAQAAPKGPLHGVPVLLKDNIDAVGLPTTAGAIALADNLPAADAFITRKLREAGAIVLGKAQLTEFANFTSPDMPSGFSGIGGQTLNPYDPRPPAEVDGAPRLSPGGSSAGSAVATAANLTAISIGTETSGSILSPAAANGVVGLKPTLGLVSRTGILPLSADRDTAGPITRAVRDAAILLGVIAGHDPDDPVTAACLAPGRCHADHARFLDAEALRGARILVPAFPPDRASVMESAIDVLRARGATVAGWTRR